MAIQCQCPGCGRRLQVPETATGRRVKCPHCAAVIQVGSPKSESPPLPGDPELPRWFVQTADKKQHGPVAKRQLDRLVAEGRLDGFCHLRRADWDHWKWIEEIYPQFAATGDSESKEKNVAASSRKSRVQAEGVSEAESRLHPCPDCGKIVSRRATQCPHCGCPIGPPPARAASAGSESTRKSGGQPRNRKIVMILAVAGSLLVILAASVLYVE